MDIHSKTIAVQGVVCVLVRECVGTFVDTAIGRPNKAVAVVICSKRNWLRWQQHEVKIVQVLSIVIGVRRIENRNKWCSSGRRIQGIRKQIIIEVVLNVLVAAAENIPFVL